ncbi:MAG: Rieske 2Fe-2S domain-containing protein [Synechococcus sp.]|nr:Rieske 2Fe-2S domain-containing protein [Synechococcus sp.]
MVASPLDKESQQRWQRHWQERWYPVAYLEDLDPLRPTPFTLLGQDLVLWWDGTASQWRAFVDVCPHRQVPLSEGRINERGELECPYHGWSFNGKGHCTTIPQAEPEAAVSACRNPRSSCRSFATATAQGLLFVFAGPAAQARLQDLPRVPPLDEPSWLVQDTFRDLPMDALTLLENVLDVSHVPFTHHRTVGRRQNAAPVLAELTGSDAAGFSISWPEGPRRGKLGSQFTTFAGPCLMWHDLTAKGFARFLTVVYATPIRPGECRLFARFPFQFRSLLPRLLLKARPKWLQHLGNHVVLEDDQVFLHWQERVRCPSFLPTSADIYVRALHDWVDAVAGPPFPGATLPTRLGNAQLMDRYESHTRHCRSCSGALLGMRRWRPLLLGTLVVELLLAAWLPGNAARAGLVLLIALTALLLRQLCRWEELLQRGDGQPPRNRH